MANDKQSTLSFHEFLLSICLLQPQIQHGGKLAEFRCAIYFIDICMTNLNSISQSCLNFNFCHHKTMNLKSRHLVMPQWNFLKVWRSPFMK